MGTPMYDVGDVVFIVDEPNRECAFKWASPVMDAYCGMKAKITSRNFSSVRGAWRYRLDIDNATYMWCEKCFKSNDEMVELEESNIPLDFLLS